MAQSSTAADPVADRLTRRYPPPRVSRPVTIALVALAAVIGVGWTVWVGVDMATPAASARLNTYQVLSDTEAEFSITVQRRDTEVPVMCRVIAQAENFERVGELAVEVPPGGESLTELDLTIRTFRRAVSVSVDGCTAR